jgi:hypothetical protein
MHQIWASTYKIFTDWTTMEVAVTDWKIQVICVVTLCEWVYNSQQFDVTALSSPGKSSFLSSWLTLKEQAVIDAINVSMPLESSKYLTNNAELSWL